MSERYKKIFDLTKNLYVEGAPAIIAAGALLMDTQTNCMLAQLKFQSVIQTKILALKAEITCFDTAGRVLGDPVEHQYLDLHISIGEEFGSKGPVYLPDASTRSFSARITEVTFSDGTIWNESGKEWEALSPQQPLSFGDQEMEKQFRIQYGQQCKFAYMKQKDLWHCPCGAINREDTCHACKISLLQLENFDLNVLEAARKERLTNEKITAQKKANIKSTIFVITGVVLFIILAVSIIWGIRTNNIKQQKYTEARKLMLAEKYEEAVVLLFDLDYQASEELLDECYEKLRQLSQLEEAYQVAVDLFSEHQIILAKEHFEKLGSYKDSAHYVTYIDAVTQEMYQAETLYRSLPKTFLDVEQILWFLDTNRIWSNRMYYLTESIGPGSKSNQATIRFYKDFRTANSVFFVYANGIDEIDDAASIGNILTCDKWNINSPDTTIFLNEKIPDSGVVIGSHTITQDKIVSVADYYKEPSKRVFTFKK